MIRIDKDGVWFYQGAEMFRRDIVNFFYENLQQDATGRYVIQLPGEDGDHCFVDVEDTAFVVKSVHGQDNSQEAAERLEIFLSDEKMETLDPRTLRIGPDNVVYCTVRNGAFDARFSRSAYYQLAEHIEHDDEKDAFFLMLKDQRFYFQNPTNI